MITDLSDVDDPRLEVYRKLGDPAALLDAGLFVAEGRLVVQRLLAGKRFAVHSVLLTPAAHAALAEVSPLHADGVPVFIVPQQTMNGVTGFNMHRGCLALAVRPAEVTLTPDHIRAARRVLVLEGVNNPDNVGGLFRSAAAFAVDLVVIGPGCSDPLYRKAIRTSMAAALQVPFVNAGPWPEAIDTLRGSGFSVVALTPARDATVLDDVPRHLAKVALLAGAEGAGLSAPALARADLVVHIPMAAGMDSLNVTVAASIALHHLR